jgi:hypothetical protein
MLQNEGGRGDADDDGSAHGRVNSVQVEDGQEGLGRYRAVNAAKGTIAVANTGTQNMSL